MAEICAEELGIDAEADRESLSKMLQQPTREQLLLYFNLIKFKLMLKILEQAVNSLFTCPPFRQLTVTLLAHQLCLSAELKLE